MAFYVLCREVKAAAIEQDCTFFEPRNYDIYGVSLYLYFHNDPAGIVDFTIFDEDNNSLFTDEITSSAFKTAISATESFYGGFYGFTFSDRLVLTPGTYTFQLKPGTGYSFSASSFIAWGVMHENLINNISYTPFSDVYNPNTIKVYERQVS